MSKRFLVGISLFLSILLFSESVFALALLNTTLDNPSAVTNPLSGTGVGSSVSTNPGNDFTSALYGNGIRLDATSEYVRFVQKNGVQNIELDKGTMDFWYLPAYSSTDGLRHAIISVGNFPSAGSMRIYKDNNVGGNSNSLGFVFVNSTGKYLGAYVTQNFYSWTSGQWVHIRATWDFTVASGIQNMHLYIDGTERQYGFAGPKKGSTQMPTEDPLKYIYVGHQPGSVLGATNGIVDEFVILDRAEPPSVADNIPPVISNPNPNGVLPSGSTQITISVATDENASCKYSITDDTYLSMPNTFSITGSVNHSQFVNGLVDGGNYNYYVRCQDGSGNMNNVSAIINFSIAQFLDTTAPSVFITSPFNSSTVSGITIVTAIASDNIGIAGIQFKLNGLNIDLEDITDPYSIIWDTTKIANDIYALVAVARDTSNNNATSLPVIITVNNTLPISTTGRFTQGAFVQTLGALGGSSSNFTIGGTVGPNWVMSSNYSAFDIFLSVDKDPGIGNFWKVSAEHATLFPTQVCADIKNWNSVNLCTITSSTRTCGLNNVPVNITGPACFRIRMALVNGTRLKFGGGTLAIHFSDGPIHFQGHGAASITNGTFYGGNVFRSTNIDRTYFISPGIPIKSVGGVMAIPTSPGAEKTWNVQFVYSNTSLNSGQNCADLNYNIIDVCTISGATQKECHWSPVLIDAPAGSCFQVRGVCSGGACAKINNKPDYTLDVYSDVPTATTYETAGSGAFDLNHSFGIGPWAISDAKPREGVPFLGQMFWHAPGTGLNACAGAFTFENLTTGTGQYDIGLTSSTTVPLKNQGCLDLNYFDSISLCSLKPGDKSCSFNLTAFNITPNGCFALKVKTSGGTPSNKGQFNWQASCVSNYSILG